jgi:hypothetical protein
MTCSLPPDDGRPLTAEELHFVDYLAGVAEHWMLDQHADPFDPKYLFAHCFPGPISRHIRRNDVQH